MHIYFTANQILLRMQGKAKMCEELNPNIPPALAAIVKKTMEVDKLKRYSSMDDLREALVGIS